jgi:hypothetical protein
MQMNDKEKHSNSALIIFTRNPELGKCKTRLAATVGNESALEIYNFLLAHTASITQDIAADVFIFYSETIEINDIWNSNTYKKLLQTRGDLGAKMKHAFETVFNKGYTDVIIIGSDIYELTTSDIEKAFQKLHKNNVVIGPAVDGGYYLLGLQTIYPAIFKNKEWGTNTVLKDSLLDLKEETVVLLDKKNDVDYYEDIKDIAIFQDMLPIHLQMKHTT